MRRIALAFLFLITFSSSGLAGDLSANPVLPDSMVISNKRAVAAAYGYARALFPEDSAEYSAHLKKALNSAVLTTHNVRLKDPSLSTSAEVTTSIFDKDPRYRANMNALVYYDPGLDNDRIWNGQTTKGYLNTVVITGASTMLRDSRS